MSSTPLSNIDPNAGPPRRPRPKRKRGSMTVPVDTESLTCSVCMKFMLHMMVMGVCGHGVCFECVVHMMVLDIHNEQLRCPVCREECCPSLPSLYLRNQNKIIYDRMVDRNLRRRDSSRRSRQRRRILAAAQAEGASDDIVSDDQRSSTSTVMVPVNPAQRAVIGNNAVAVNFANVDRIIDAAVQRIRSDRALTSAIKSDFDAVCQYDSFKSFCKWRREIASVAQYPPLHQEYLLPVTRARFTRRLREFAREIYDNMQADEVDYETAKTSLMRFLYLRRELQGFPRGWTNTITI